MGKFTEEQAYKSPFRNPGESQRDYIRRCDKSMKCIRGSQKKLGYYYMLKNNTDAKKEK